MDELSPVKRALVELRTLRARVDELERAHNEPIAVVGMACRVPGADSPDALWRLLLDGGDPIVEVPPDRWSLDQWYDPDPDAAGKMYTRRGGFLRDIDQFDPGFFGISMREAQAMDPQQRLLLEVAWHALEDAGQAPGRRAARTGVFAGLCGSDYSRWHVHSGDPRRIDAYSFSGTAFSIATGRISYVLGLEGPSIAVDTACSSSLVAVHLACQSLREGECDAALAGGVNLMLSPEGTVYFSRMRAMAPDGRCKAFDAAADGYVRGEGCAFVVLRRLSDALADGDLVRAVIRGSAVNQDGRSNGLTAPNRLAQEALLRQALARARVAPADVAFVEAHGTGTPLGDPIEVLALASVLGEGRTRERPLRIGSIKANLGHLEAAAGAASLLKAVLALQKARVPPQAHFRTPNPHIPWADLAIEVPREALPLPAGATVGVSAFGFSGTNAHVVLQAAPERSPAPAARRPEVLALSARSASALRALATRYAEILSDDASLRDVCFSAHTGRAALDHRLAVVGDTPHAVRRALESFAREGAHLGYRHVAGDRPAVAFLFAGQGTQYPGLGGALYRTEPAFRMALHDCDERLAVHLGRSIVPLLVDPDEGQVLRETGFAQPALFAFAYALVELWRALGVRPDLVAGHSVGEIAAACASGALGLEDAALLVCERGRRMQALPRGAMAAVAGNEATVRAVAAGYGDLLGVAAVNSPDQVVLSGDSAALAHAVDQLRSAGHAARALDVSHAFHSPAMDGALSGFEAALSALHAGPPRVPFISTVTGARADDLGPSYWSRQLRASVRFGDAMRSLASEGARVFVEIGPDATLLALARRTCRAGAFVPSQRPHVDPRHMLAEAVATLFRHGVEVDGRAWAGPGASRVTVPAYPFERTRVWMEPPPAGATSDEPAPFAGARRPSPLHDRIVFESRLRAGASPFDGHRIHGTVLVPGAGYLALVLAAVREAFGSAACTLEDITFHRALALGGRDRPVQVVLSPEGAAFQVHALDDAGAWQLHAAGRIVRGEPAAGPVTASPAEGEPLEATRFYEALERWGFALGEDYRWHERLWRGKDAVRSVLRAPRPGDDVGRYELHPGMADALFHLARGTFSLPDGGADAYVPLHVGRFRYWGRPGGQLWAEASLREAFTGQETLAVDLRLWDGTRPVAQAEDVSVKRAPAAALLGGTVGPDWLHEMRWHEAPRGEPAPARRWLLLGDISGFGSTLARQMQAEGTQASVAPSLDGHDDVDSVVSLAALEGGSLDAGCAAALHLAQALVTRPSPPALWLVTRRAQAAGGAVDVEQAALWGLARVVAREHPQLLGGIVDIDGGPDEACRLAEELLHADGEAQVALRGARRLVPRLEPLRAGPASSSPPTLSAEATYLVTGGLGSLGSRVARWLVERGARHLALLSRHRDEEALAALAGTGARVVHLAADVAVAAEVASALATLSDGPPLRGVIHAAGVLDDAALGTQEWARWRAVLRPKVEGAWNVHQVTANADLDFFVLFSSAASVLGPEGQSSYAAANAFLDALAQHRRDLGRPALSIGWGPWAGVGMAKHLDERAWRRLHERGLDAIEPDAGLALLGPLLAHPASHVAVLPLRRGSGVGVALRPPRATTRPRLDLAGAAGPARLTRLLAHVQAEAADVLGWSDPSALPTAKPLGELGLDSVMALELARRLSESVGRPLPPTLLFNHPTMEALARRLGEEVPALEPAVVSPGARPAIFEGRPTRAAGRRPATPAAIAVVGLSCRFPGAPSAEEFWRLVAEGTDAVTEVPRDRWNVDEWYDPELGPDTMNTRRGGFIDGIDQFDPAFFDVSVREAAGMDPQQRLLLEVAWEALEDAGVSATRLDGSRTGVFLGLCNGDYAVLHARPPQRGGTGVSLGVAANRLSYFFNLHGPSFVVDTACSSSLLAVHLACQSLRAGECDVALAGGVNVILSPTSTVSFAQAGMMAPDGRCKTFDASADGYVRGEGCGIVVLRRLADARADRARVRAVVAGSATNQDGRSQGLTAPNGRAQVEVIRTALHKAGVAPHEVGYVEAHGTGTSLGDAVEVEALATALGDGRATPCLLSAVKTNIGHLEAAAGVAAFIKAVLSLQHGAVPPVAHLRELNPKIPFAQLPFVVPRTLQAWPSADATRYAGVSGFSFGGSNVHVVLAEAEREDVAVSAAAPREAEVLPVSAKDERALRELARRYAEHLEARPDLDPADLCFSAGEGRAALPERLAVCGADRIELAERLRAVADGRPAPGTHRGRAEAVPPEVPREATTGPAEALARLFVRGANVDWAGRHPGARRVDLPTYPFAHRRCWLEPGELRVPGRPS
jgi:acyl transferase domain-containing protein/acyl carrier protein